MDGETLIWPDWYFFSTGSTEAEAKQDALQKALGTLALLFAFKSLPKCSTVKETEVQINTLLRTKGQKELIYSHKRNLYKSSVELLFKDYTMESKQEKKKKENINHLSSRILGLLAEEPGKDHKEVRSYKLNCKRISWIFTQTDGFLLRNNWQHARKNQEIVHLINLKV